MGEAPSFTVLPLRFSVVRLDPRAAPPEAPAEALFWSLTLTTEELSVVCDEASGERLRKRSSSTERCQASPRSQQGFRALKLTGPLDFSLTGVLARLLAPLAAAEIPVFVVSTFDTDYILVREEHLHRTIEALERSALER